MIGSLTPCFWFKTEAEEAARWYCSIFPDSEIKSVQRMSADGPAMGVGFKLMGQSFSALNMAQEQSFTENLSFMVFCDTQAEIDLIWDRLTEGGSEGRCGWLKDRYGVSWQVIPRKLTEWMSDPVRGSRVVQAFMPMKKLIIADLERA